MTNKPRPFHIILLIFNIAIALVFGSIFLLHKNYEFAIYVGAIIACLAIICVSFFKVPYSNATLIALTFWTFLHVSGGAIYLNGSRLYDIILLPLSQTLPILRYDQLVHVWGFGAATLTIFDMLKPLLKENLNRFVALSTVVIMAGLGAGALNEIIEAIVTAVIPSSGVGGYLNTALDLIADLIGAILAMLFIHRRYLKI